MFSFKSKSVAARFKTASDTAVKRQIEIREDPIIRKKARITFSRSKETELGLEIFYHPPERDMKKEGCPFCPDNLMRLTPTLPDAIEPKDRMIHNESILFPNLFPYTEYSAVSLFGLEHYVELGEASIASYRDSFINCSHYLKRVIGYDPDAVYMAVTQNHLPAAGGSLVHPHLQVHAAKEISNRHAVFYKSAKKHQEKFGSNLFSDFLKIEKDNKIRYIGTTGSWEWIAAFAPRGFYEIIGISPGSMSLTGHGNHQLWQDLATGITHIQKFYKSMNRNSYNLGILSIEKLPYVMELMVSVTARSSYAPWVRSDITGFELAFDEMATFSSPEDTAKTARIFWE